MSEANEIPIPAQGKLYVDTRDGVLGIIVHLPGAGEVKPAICYLHPRFSFEAVTGVHREVTPQQAINPQAVPVRHVYTAEELKDLQDALSGAPGVSGFALVWDDDGIPNCELLSIREVADHPSFTLKDAKQVLASGEPLQRNGFTLRFVLSRGALQTCAK